jgi:hypothetical protein
MMLPIDRHSLIVGLACCLLACSAPETSPTSTSSSNSGAGGTSVTSATAGNGGAGGAIDNGMPSDVYPAFHPTLPTITKEAGSVIAAPVIVPVYFQNDDATTTGHITDFASGLGTTSYWAAVTGEYGVGPATSDVPVEVSESPTGTIDDTAISAWLAQKLNANDSAFPTADDNTIFLLVYPPGVTVTIQGEQGCVNLGAYHNSVKLDAAHASLPVAYAVIPNCPNFHGFTGIDEITLASSHELIEAATDPFPMDTPAYDLPDPDHTIWTIYTGNEICDFCDNSASSYTKLPGFDYMIERCWSNKSAALLHDPCVPGDASLPYFNSAPVLDGTVHFQTLTFPGVIIPVGQTRDVELDLFSEAKTGGPWSLSAEDLAPSFGGAAELEFSFDRSSGVNGEKIHLSVTAKKKAASGFSLFVLKSSLGDQTSSWVIPVGNQ